MSLAQLHRAHRLAASGYGIPKKPNPHNFLALVCTIVAVVAFAAFLGLLAAS